MKRLLLKGTQLLGGFLIVTGLSFLVMRLAPSDPALVKIANSTVTVSDDALQRLREQMGLNRSLWQQYWTWMTQLLSGHLGVSLMSDQPIAPQLGVALLNSLQLAILSLVPSIGVAIPFGFVMMDLRHSRSYRSIQTVLAVLMAVPSFVLAYLMMEVFSVHWNLLPLLAVNGGLGLVMPTVALWLPMMAKFTGQLESLFYSEMKKPYVHALTYRGMSRSVIYYRHILKNVAPTIVTMVLLSFGSLMGGVVVIETLFYWPGVGKYLMDAIQNRDYPVVQATLCILVLLYLLLTQVAEWLSTRMNPQWKGREEHE